MDTMFTCTLEDLQHISSKNIGSFCSNSLGFCEICELPRAIFLGKTGRHWELRFVFAVGEILDV